MSNATHFIEVYAAKQEYKSSATRPYHETFMFPIGSLKTLLSQTASCRTMETVAVFKIKAK